MKLWQGKSRKLSKQRRAGNNICTLNLEHFFEPGEIPRYPVRYQRDIFQPHATQSRIIKPGFHRDDLPGFQFTG